MNKKRITWKHPVKSKEKAEKILMRDKLVYAGTFSGITMGNPKVDRKRHKDGSLWFHIMVDEI